MNDEQLRTLADLEAFMDGTVAMDFAVAADERYEFIARTVRHFGYGRLKRADKAVALRFPERVSGYPTSSKQPDSLEIPAHSGTARSSDLSRPIRPKFLSSGNTPKTRIY